MTINALGHRKQKPRQAYDGVEVSLAAGVALKPGNSISGEIICCGCGLTHIHRYRITRRGTLKLTAWRK